MTKDQRFSLGTDLRSLAAIFTKSKSGYCLKRGKHIWNWHCDEETRKSIQKSERLMSSFYRWGIQVWERLPCALAGWWQSVGQEPHFLVTRANIYPATLPLLRTRDGEHACLVMLWWCFSCTSPSHLTAITPSSITIKVKGRALTSHFRQTLLPYFPLTCPSLLSPRKYLLYYIKVCIYM